jgi:hypothetical protein
MLMVLVALVALGLGGYVQYRRLRRLSVEYRDRAALYARRGSENSALERQQRRVVALYEGYLARDAKRRDETTDTWERRFFADECNTLWKPLISSASRRATSFRARADYYAEMVRKCSRAASRPWLPVASDPTEPPPPE